MRSYIGKNSISILFLSVFLLLRIADAHAFSHFSDGEDDSTHCELCEIIAVSQQFTPFVDQIPVETESSSIVFPEQKQINPGYEEPLHCFVSPSFVYNKPPPGLI